MGIHATEYLIIVRLHIECNNFVPASHRMRRIAVAVTDVIKIFIKVLRIVQVFTLQSTAWNDALSTK